MASTSIDWFICSGLTDHNVKKIFGNEENNVEPALMQADDSVLAYA